MLSPEAKALKATANDGKESSKVLSVGDGERRLFYLSVMHLFELTRKIDICSVKKRLATDALQVLIRAAPFAGGSRDICSLVECMCEIIVLQGLAVMRKGIKDFGKDESLSTLVGYGVTLVNSKIQDDDVVALDYLMNFCAETLGQDVAIVRRNKSRRSEIDDDKSASSNELPSTLHVFLPHRDRGRLQLKKRKRTQATKKKVSDRQLVNCVAEILIWSKTSVATSNKTFQDSFDAFLNAAVNREPKEMKQNLHIMQTKIRHFRQELNSYAREHGFMVSDQFLLDKSSLTIGQINCGKAGDISKLTRLATKNSEAKVLRMIQLRFASNPSKVTKYGSVNELIRAAVMMPTSTDELALLERGIHVDRVRATIGHLHSLVAQDSRGVLISSIESSQSNHITAILVAAALSWWNSDTCNVSSSTSEKVEVVPVKFFIGGVRKSITCFDECLDLLGEVIFNFEMTKNEMDAESFMDEIGLVTTKAVINIVNRHLQDSEMLLLITSADTKCPDDFLSDLTNRGCSIHCHDPDDIGERLRREKAQKGDITISLAWDTEDDLDLSVIIPSGEKIYYGHKKSEDGNCILDVDMNVGGGSTEPVENVHLGNLDLLVEAPLGKYIVQVTNYNYHTDPPHGDVPFCVIVEKNGIKEKFSGSCKGMSDDSIVVVCQFEYEGRKVPLPKEAEGIAFRTANVVNLTASTGQTLESLSHLVQTVQQQKHINEIRTLLQDDMETDNENSRPILADSCTLEVTSRDRLYMRLAGLPERFHMLVGEYFGGPTLAEKCAEEVAARMIRDKIPLSELKRNRYPDDIIVAIKTKIAKSGFASVKA